MMKFKLGEFVRFVDERREGFITRIIDDQMVGVTGDDDFEIPVPVNKITRVHGYKYDELADAESASPAASPGEFQTKGIYLAVVPDARKGSVVYFHLVNESSFQLMATLTVEKKHHFKGEFAGIIAPHSSTKIYSATLSELDLWPKFTFQILYFTKQDIALPDPLVTEKKFKAKDFAGAKKTVSLLKEQAWPIRLDEEELVIDADKLKESFYKLPEEKQSVEKPAKEIDLHIEKLRDDHQFLSKTEILKIQLEQFRKSLDAAIVHKLPSIIFIHGVGNGTLRHELHKILSKHQQVKTFMDARKEKFGYGATEVVLK